MAFGGAFMTSLETGATAAVAWALAMFGNVHFQSTTTIGSVRDFVFANVSFCVYI